MIGGSKTKPCKLTQSVFLRATLEIAENINQILNIFQRNVGTKIILAKHDIIMWLHLLVNSTPS